MPNARFDRPVTVRNPGGGRTMEVADALGAAEILLRRWPDQRADPWRLRAMSKCLGAMEGQCSGRALREAFTLAAANSDMLVEPNKSERSGH